MKTAYIALGSNLDVPAKHIEQALEDLAQLPESNLAACSNWYKTEAIGGPANQPDYINAACCLSTALAPDLLLKELQAIEQQHGRLRLEHWGPRTLDLDIIWYQDVSSQDPSLTLPHPRAHQRAFVLQPLLDLNAEFPLQGHSLSHWRQQLHDQRIEQISLA